MPAYISKADRKKRNRKTARRSTPSDPTTVEFRSDVVDTGDPLERHIVETVLEFEDAPEPQTVGRLRQYLDASNGRDFDPTNPATIEGRLLDPNSACWFVPESADAVRGRRQRKGRRVSDINAGDVGRYRMSDWSVRAKDDRGHGTSIRVSMPDQMADELNAIVNAKVFPPRDVEALARTFIYEGILHVRALARQDGLTIPHSHFAHLEAIAVGHRHVLAVLQYDDMLVDYCNSVRDLLGRGAKNKARAAILDMLEIVKKLDSTELRERWNYRIRVDFAHILKGRGAQVHVSNKDSKSGANE